MIIDNSVKIVPQSEHTQCISRDSKPNTLLRNQNLKHSKNGKKNWFQKCQQKVLKLLIDEYRIFKCN